MSREEEKKRALVAALVTEAGCILVGVGVYLATGNWVWLLAGVLLGTGFSAPALIKYMRAQGSPDA